MPEHLLEHQPDRDAYQNLGANTSPAHMLLFTIRALSASPGTPPATTSAAGADENGAATAPPVIASTDVATENGAATTPALSTSPGTPPVTTSAAGADAATTPLVVTSTVVATENDAITTWEPKLTTMVDNTSAPVTILFTPSDSPNIANRAHLNALHSALKIPSAYLLERHQSVTHSFSCAPTHSWLHFLYKTIQLNIIDPTLYPGRRGYGIAGNNGQDDTWMKGGWYLSYTKPKDMAGGYRVVMLSSGYFPELETRLQEWLERDGNLQTVREDPYALWIPVLMELWKGIDNVVWGLNAVFGGLEASIMNRSLKGGIDYQELHNLAKHAIHLTESSSAILCSIESLIRSHKHLFPSSSEVHYRIEYLQNLFMSISLRLASMSKRIDNAINLAFNIVAQEANTGMIEDAAKMTVVTIITMVFLPGTAVATIFGSNFFSMAEDGSFSMSATFWLFWLVTLPVTVMVYVLWRWSLGLDMLPSWSQRVRMSGQNGHSKAIVDKIGRVE